MYICTTVSTCVLGVTRVLLFGVVVLVVLVVSVVVFRLLAFSSRWMGLGVLRVVLFSVSALRLVLVQNKLIGFYNRDEKCLQRGTDWMLIQGDQTVSLHLTSLL